MKSYTPEKTGIHQPVQEILPVPAGRNTAGCLSAHANTADGRTTVLRQRKLQAYCPDSDFHCAVQVITGTRKNRG